MTSPRKNPISAGPSAGQSSLPFDERDLLGVRLLPSEFSRACGVSRQCVSQWIKIGKVTLGADGRLDPTRAFRQLLRSGDPGRIRARLVRQAFADMADLRAEAGRAALLEQQLADAQQRIDFLEGFSKELGQASEIAPEVLADAIGEIHAAADLNDRAALVACFADLLDRALLRAASELAGLDDIDLSRVDSLPASAARSEAVEKEGARSDVARRNRHT
ncbi:hypothetical protein [Propionivibrio sp.]|uniref:hypothetical protein n=1 Tax=Propionivibrio sp. TaxID=2212460 RepID=UPI00272DE59E|nr:hypothetical protein [Propionivibrio sp.]